MDVQPSPITPQAWLRLLTALDAGVPPYAACRYAGISPFVWERERERIPEFGLVADQVEMSGLVAAWRFLQGAAASEWRASLEFVRLHNATRGRDMARVDEWGSDDPDAVVTPEDVAAVIRILRDHEVGVDGVADDHSNGRRVRSAANGAGEVTT
jgi:hypothetical protein